MKAEIFLPLLTVGSLLAGYCAGAAQVIWSSTRKAYDPNGQVYPVSQSWTELNPK
jgi:hypothetical protein